ncbi:MAG: DUF4369 domain-containing protein [Bacteroidota bacterium]|nr:DUF4369 domain-containing protein [Bacteroidota bacterium]
MQNKLKHRLIPLLACYLAIFFLFSCTSKDGQKVFISGNFPSTGKLVIFAIHPVGMVPVDSIAVNDKNEFSTSIKVQEPGFFMICNNKGNHVILSVKPGEKIILNATDQKGIWDYHISGSPESGMLESFFRAARKNEIRSDSLVSDLRSYANTSDFYKISLHCDTLFDKIAEEQRALQMEFLIKNPNALASLIVLNYTFGGQSLLKIERNPGIFLKTDSLLGKEYPGNEQVIFHHKRVMAWKTIQKNGN